jgi:hypothetical protein
MPNLVFVLGMGRSGSSALTRILSACGGMLPRALFPGNTSNPAGHWEPRAAVRMNQDFLLAHRSSWFDPSLRLQTPGTISPKAGGRLISAAARFLEEERVPADACLVVKEPRVAALLPYWLEAADRVGFQTKAIFLYRHPEEVARSLSVRDGLSRDHGYLLWLKYNLLSEAGSRQLRRAAFSFESLLESPCATLATAFAQADLPLRVPAARAVSDLLDPHLRHHRADRTRLSDPAVAGLAMRAWDLLGALREGRRADAGWDRLLVAFSQLPGGRSRPREEGSWNRNWGLRLAQLLRRELPRGWTPSGLAHGRQAPVEACEREEEHLATPVPREAGHSFGRAE